MAWPPPTLERTCDGSWLVRNEAIAHMAFVLANSHARVAANRRKCFARTRTWTRTLAPNALSTLRTLKTSCGELQPTLLCRAPWD